MTTPPAFYRRAEGDALEPTDLAAGPEWVPGSQHASVVTALMARAVEATPSTAPLRLTRLTVDLSRVVPTGLTRARSSVRRDGSRVQVVDVDLTVDGKIKASANAL